MTYHIVRILKMLVVALNRKELLTGKENNQINKSFESIEDSRKNRRKKAKKVIKGLTVIKGKIDKLKDINKKVEDVFNSADK